MSLTPKRSPFDPLANHLIQRQVLELHLARSLPVTEIQSEAEFLLTHEVWPKLDAICSRLEVPRHSLRIERMEIDLPPMSYVELRARFSEEVCRQFEAKLKSYTASAAVELAVRDPLETRNPHVAEEDSVIERSGMQDRLEALGFFFQHGLLPWWWDRKQADPRNLLEELLKGSNPEARRWLRKQVREETRRVRLCAQFDSATVGALLQFLITNPVPARTISEWHSRVLQRSATSRSSTCKPSALIGVESHLLATASALAEGPESIEVEALELLRRAERQLEAVIGGSLGDSNRAGNHAEKPTRPSDKPTQTDSAESDSRSAAESRSVPPMEADLTTEVAGLVLFWPYLERFFAAVDLIEAGVFRDRDARVRAVHLLHFLAAGQEGAPEPALILPKLLCGVPITDPVPFQVELSELERIEAAQLLEAVIKNWPPLKNTSPGGLRQAFLLREGRLALPEEVGALPGWRLRVERKGHDILLEQLPWGLYLVKLPWMPQPLYVEW